jgi:hypothetical protein
MRAKRWHAQKRIVFFMVVKFMVMVVFAQSASGAKVKELN